MSSQTASSFAMFSLIAGLAMVGYADLSAGGLGKTGGAKRYLAVGLAGGAALLVAPFAPSIATLGAMALLGAVAYSTLGATKTKAA